MEADPIFRNRTKKFDGGMIINSLEVDRGLTILLDSDLAEYCKQTLIEATKRLPKKGTDPSLLKLEQQRNQSRDEW